MQESQVLLFWFLGASAIGLLIGGLVGDRVGPKTVIWFSILGVLPFTLALPYANLAWIQVLTVVIGLIFSSAFPAIVVLGQELVPGRVGLIAGMVFGTPSNVLPARGRSRWRQRLPAPGQRPHGPRGIPAAA